MKFNKKILICALLVLMIICCVNAVNAAEPLNDTLETSDAGVIALDEGSDDALSASGDTLVVDANGGGDYTSISAAAGAATGGETIFVKNGEYTEETMSGMSKQLTFTGESQDGVIVRTTGTTGFFTTTESGYTSLTFNNITFKDVHTTGSNAVINIGGNGDVYINDCTFDNCDGRYGALRIFTSGTATVDNCKFLDTKSSTGSYSSAIDFGGSGSSVYTLKNSIIDGSEKASTSTATYFFGAIYIEKSAGTVVLDNVTISNCNLASSNAIISAKANTEIKRSKIVNNTVMRDDFAYSSLIFIPTGNKLVTVESSLIADNSEPNYLVSSNSASSSFDLNYNNIRDNTFKEGIHHATGSYTLDANWWGSNELPSGVTASTWVVEDNGEYKLNTGEDLAKDIPELTGGDEPGPEPAVYVYVSPDGDDANDGSSKENAVRTIEHAYEIAPEGGSIYILNGTYIIESEDYDFGRGLTIAKSVSFIGEDINGVLFDLGNGATIFVRDEVDLAFEHISFVGAVERNVILVRSPIHELNVTNCAFKDLQITEGVICFDDEGGKLNIIGNYFEAPRSAIEMYGQCELQAHNNIFFCGEYPVIDYIGASTGNVDYNYYGSNDRPDIGFIAPTYWVISSTTADPADAVETGDEVTVSVDFNQYTDGTTTTSQSNLIPDLLTINFSAEGTLSDESVLINNGVATTTYTSDVGRTDRVRAKLGNIEVGSVDVTVIEPYKGIIYVNKTGDDSNVGSIDAPVATINKAIELALAEGGSGQIIIDEGTYTGYDYHVTGDLTVTGNGKVTLDANNEGRLFYMSYGDAASKLELSNLILTNAKGYGAAVYSFANELILDNVTIVNNKATGYLIKSNGKLTIKDSNITNSMSGDVIQQSGNGDILITNTVFENNSVVDTTSVFSVIYLSSGTGNLVIEDSKFINNTARQGIIKGNANYNINVKGTEFINNTNTVSYGGAIYAYGPTLDVTGSTFINNKAYTDGGAIYVGWRTDAAVDKSIFINNTAGTTSEGDAIYNGNKLSVGNSVLLTNAAHHLIYNDGEDNVVNAQNNWWGTNDDPKDLVASGYYEDDDYEEYPCGEVDVSNWATMDASFAPEDAQAGDEVTVTATFSNTDLPDGIEVTFGSTSGLNEVVSTVAGQASTTYTIDANDEAITATSTNAVIEMPIVSPFTTNIVTNDTFYKFFDESGFLKDTVPFDELIFQGEFSDLAAGYIIIDQPISIISDNAVLNDLGIMVAASDVKIDGLTLNANGSLGDLINVGEYSDVDLTNLTISYIVGDEEANAINVIGGSNVNIVNNTIYFESHITEDESQTTAINIDSESTEILIENNTIVANFPALLAETYDWSYFGMGLTLVNPVRIYEAETVEIRKNNIDVTINYLYRTTPTVQALYVAGSNDVIIDGNNITMIDEFTPEGTDVYIYAVEIYFDTEVVFTNNNVNISTNGGKDGAGAAYPVNIISSEVEIKNNNLTTVSNGPNLGIYSPYGFGAAKEFTIEDNFINVTGFVGKKNDYALLSAIELQTGYANIYNNTIYVQNKGDYSDDYYVTGISAIQYSAPTLTFDVKDNEIYTNGKYTVEILYPPSQATVTGNTLYAHELKGDESVYIKSGDNNVVEDNLPVKPLANITITAYPVWTGSNGIVTVNVPNATGTITIEVNGKSYDVELDDGVATKEIPAENLVTGENVINATYNGPEFISNSNTGVLFVADGVVTQDTYLYYFNQDDNGKFFDYIPEGATLDFQGSIINPDQSIIVQMNVNKPVNIVSTTKDAYVDLNTTAGSLLGESPGNSFAITYGGSGSNVTGINFHNTQLWFSNTHNVILDNISNVVEDQRVGSGVGATSIRDNSSNVLLKNSYFYTRNNGGSTTFTFSWATNCTIDNCTVKAEGNVGNLVYLNTFNVVGAPTGVPLNNYNTVSNNKIYGKEGSGISVGLMVEGANNLIVNNTLFKSSISTSFGSVNPANNTYVGNIMTEGSGLTAQANSIVYGNNVTGALSTGANSVVYNNTVGGKMTVGAGATAYDNTVGKGLGTGGANAIIENNTIVGAVTINKVGTTFVGNNVTGTVTVSANDNVIKENSINTTGAYAVDLGSKTGNNVTENYLIASELQGDAAVKFTNANNIVENNYPAESNVTISVEDAVYGEDVVVNVEFNPITSGTIVVSVDGIDYPVEIVSEGKGSVVIPGLAAKDYDVTVTFTGDAPYSIDSENNASFTVFKANATVEATADSVKVGDDVIVNVTFDKDDVTGTVSINVEGTDYTGTVENGAATIVIPDLAADEYTLDVVYLGDDNYNDTVADVSFAVEKYAVDFTKAKGHPGRVDKNATVDVILSESDATGTVSIIVNGTEYSAELVDGAAVIYAPLLPAGTYNFDVIYSGDDKYENNSAPITFNVNKYYPTMKATAESVRVDENANVIVSLPEDATGTVTITVDGVDYTADVIDGTATVELPVISEAGSQKFVVTYSGDDKYRPQTTNVEFNVLKYNANIKATARTVKLGNNVTVNVVLPEDATGEVSITINDTSYTGVAENGAATIIIPDLGVGQYALTVDYSGDDNYKPTNTTVTFNVNKQTTSMKATARTVKVGADVTVNVALASDATGEVVMEVNGVNYTATVEDGAATIVIPDLPYGQYAFDVVYSGDDKYKTRTATVTFNVNKQTTTMKATAKTVKVGDDVTVNVALASDVTGDVIITVDGVDYTATVEDGIATIVIPDLPAGQYALDVKYSGDDKYKNQSTTVKFNVNKYNVKMKATAKYYADGDYSIVSVTLSDDATGSVSVEVNGNNYTVNVVDGSALVAISKLPAGEYPLDVVYSGDAKYKDYTATTTLKVEK